MCVFEKLDYTPWRGVYGDAVVLFIRKSAEELRKARKLRSKSFLAREAGRVSGLLAELKGAIRRARRRHIPARQSIYIARTISRYSTPPPAI